MFLQTIAKLITGFGLFLILDGVVWLFFAPFPLGIVFLTAGPLLFIIGRKLRAKAEADMVPLSLFNNGQSPSFRQNSEVLQTDDMHNVQIRDDRKEMFQTFEVSFGEPILGGILTTRDQFGFRNEGILFIDNARRVVELSGDKGKHPLAFFPLKILGNIPVWGDIIAEMAGIEFDRRATVSFPKSDIKDIVRTERIIAFLAPVNQGSAKFKRTKFMVQTETEAHKIEKALRE